MIRFSKWLLIVSLILFSCAYSQDYYLKSSSNSNSETYAFNSNKIDFSNYIKVVGSRPQETNSSDIKSTNKEFLFYVHCFGGIGFSYFSSSDIESLLGDDFGIGIGLPTWSYGLISGFKNIMQIEYNNGISNHNFNNNSIIPDIPSEIIKMDYESKDLQFKLNPFFWNMKPTNAIFLITGTGDIEWMDKEKSGFNGTNQIIGLEYSQVSKYTSWSISFKRYDISFKETVIFNIPFNIKTKATDYIMEFKVGFGFGV